MNEPKREDESFFNTPTILLLALIALPALLLRTYLFTLRPPLWLDEAMLALNIQSRNFLDLLKPLNYDQGAPIGFLWLVKLSTLLLGQNEFGLRAISLIAGGLSLLLLVLIASKVNGMAGRFFAVSAVAISFPVITYSLQVKQYSLDMLVTILIYLAAENYISGLDSSKKTFQLALVGIVAPWLSHPAVFTLAGWGLVLLVSIYPLENQTGKRNMLAALLGWALSVVVLYFVQYGGLAGNSNLTTYWAEYFMPLTVQAPYWLYDKVAELLRMPGGISNKVPYVLVVGLFTIGLASLLWRKNRWAILFSGSVLVTVAASAFGKYPFGGRLGLFLIPGMMMCLGASLDLFVTYSKKYQPLRLVLALVVGLYLLNGSARTTFENVREPKQTENITNTLEYLESNYQNGDLIYLYHFSVPVFDYYSSEYNLEKAEVIRGITIGQKPDAPAAEISALVGQKRVWFLFSHLVDEKYIKEEQSILSQAARIGFEKKSFKQAGTAISLYLFDLSTK